MFVPSFFHWYASGGVPVVTTVRAPAWPGLRLMAAGCATITGGLIGTSAPLGEVTEVTVRVTGLPVLLKNMNPSSLKTKAEAGASGFENVVWLMPGPLTQTPAPV